MSWRHPDALVQIFARAPEPGKVKTRLIPALGEQGAAELHARLLRRTVAMAQASRLAAVQLWCASEAEHPVFVETGLPRWRQQGPDLGARMAHALATGLRTAQRVVLIGLRRMADLFTGVDWGSDRVLAQTRDRLAAAGLKWQELATLWDVDRPPDLARLTRQGGWEIQ